VWIHGGAFTLGSGSQTMYDPTHLAGRDVVVVRINYRLGALGFLNLAPELGDAYEGSGNLGILDQIAALRWVRENIAAFGGDPECVTIFGESAGGMSVGTLLGTPSAHGLFHRAIPQSGAAHSVGSAADAASVVAETLAALGLSRAQTLLEVPPDKLLEAQTVVTRRLAGRALLPYRPCVDGAALPQHPHQAIADGLSAEVPVLVGTTRDEWTLLSLIDPATATLDEASLRKRVALWVGDGDALIGAYGAARRARGAPDDPRALFIAIETDRVFRIPAIRLGEAQSAHQPDTYKYLFTWESPMLGDLLGACHGIDVPFVFGSAATPVAEKFVGTGPGVQALTERTVAAWLEFARSGKPGHGDLPEWPAFEPGRRATMLLGPECGVEHDPFGAERAAWDGIL
jgi:para-nitrobenzyl esterase